MIKFKPILLILFIVGLSIIFAGCGSDTGSGSVGGGGGGGGDGGGGGNGGEIIPLKIESISPDNEATDIAPGTSIIVTFNQAIDTTNVNIEEVLTLIRNSDGVMITYSAEYDSATNSVTFIPAQYLWLGEIYTAVLSTEIKDLLGNTLLGEYTWTFNMEDKLPPGPPPG